MGVEEPKTPPPEAPAAPAAPEVPAVPVTPATPATAATPAAAAPAAAKPAVAAAKPAADHNPAAPAAPTGPTDPPPPAGTAVPDYITALPSAVPDGVTQLSFWVGDWTVIVPAEKLLDVGRHLFAAGFDFCSDVTASDWPLRPQRFDVIYCLYSIRTRQRVRLKVRAGEKDPVPSVTALWPAANWLEREVYDMFGVAFAGHPDLRRMLMPEDWQGHPQRKDYPLEGPGELLMENPLDWLRLKQAAQEAEIE